MKKILEQYFEFARLETNWRTEILAGLTTFVTMSYIIFICPSILSEAGMPFAPVFVATCISAGVGSILMGFYARFPIALAPGMGLMAYFTYAVVLGNGVSWQTGLGAVFISGVFFLVLTVLGIRRMIVSAIPPEMYAAVTTGIGLFIAFIGLQKSGIIVPHAATLVTMGHLTAPTTLLSIFCLILISVLLSRKVKGAILIGIITTLVAGYALNIIHFQSHSFQLSDIGQTALQLDIASTLKLGVAEIIFTFLFIDMFDNIGTLIAVGKRAGLFNSANEIPRINRILTSDAVATIAGSLVGTSTVVSYIESAAGVVAGGRTGVTAIVTGMLFLLSLALAPLIGIIPISVTAPALIIVGSMMVAQIGEIKWSVPDIGIPAFLTMVAIPLTFSIANGLALGLLAFTLMRLLTGRYREVNYLLYFLTALLVTKILYQG
ncbi:MAG: xantine/uracil permease [Syntrophus sp. SKADARSKE-3]|nr:xantine/uracil permease [Syntrophus sp. SKADARSKE-3]